MRAVLRDEIFDVNLAGEHLALFAVDIFAADEEMPGLGDGDGPDAVGEGGEGGEGQREGGAKGAEGEGSGLHRLSPRCRL